MIKKLILLLLLVSCIYAQTAVAPVAGDGSESNPYQIASLENLYWITADSLNWDKHYIQTANINMSECQNWKDSVWTGWEDEYDYYYGWIPIGNPFTGSYDGQHHNIDSLKINFNSFSNGKSNLGLFGRLSKASISNLTLTGIDIYNVQDLNSVNIGSVAGFCDSCVIENCSSQGYINSMKYTGGLVGKLQNSTINNCFTDGTVYGSEYAGGIAGYCINSTIDNCYSIANVRTLLEHGVGPVTGYIENSTVSHCYSVGSAYEQNYDHIYGIFGTDCFWLQWFSYPLEFTQLSYSDNKKTSTEMKDPNLYLSAGWDFVIETENGTEDIWDIDTSGAINDGYPFLHWEHPQTTYFTSISDAQIPESYCLHQNYPNPFNPATTIQYDLPERSDISLVIFDMAGRKIREWTRKGQQSGAHKIVWDGKNDFGDPVSSGVYIYRIVTDGFRGSNKMELLK